MGFFEYSNLSTNLFITDILPFTGRQRIALMRGPSKNAPRVRGGSRYGIGMYGLIISLSS